MKRGAIWHQTQEISLFLSSPVGMCPRGFQNLNPTVCFSSDSEQISIRFQDMQNLWGL